MSKPRGVEAKLSRLQALRKELGASQAVDELRTALADRSNLVVAEAAAIIGDAKIADLAAELTAAFDRLMENPTETDKLCRGKFAIAQALDKIEFDEPEVFLRGIRHVQMEPAWPKAEDSAAPLRGQCAFALVRLGFRDVLLLLADLLADPEKAARVAAAQALGATGAVAAVPLLRFKVRGGDPEPAVIAECFTALIALDHADSIPFVAGFLDDGDDALQEAAAFALGESRRPAALAHLTKFCEQAPPGPLQEVGYLALGMLRLPAATEFLLNAVAKEEPSSAKAALAGLAIQRHNPDIRERTAAAVAKNGNAAVRSSFEKKFSAK